MGYFWREILRLPPSEDIKFECERRNIHKIADTIPPPTVYGEITGGDLAHMLPTTVTIDGKQYGVRKDLWDATYKLTSVAEIKRFVNWSLTDRMDYIKESFDCDDFSFVLMGEAKAWAKNVGIVFGICLVPGHAKNWFMDGSKKLYELEPQSDIITSARTDLIHHYLL